MSDRLGDGIIIQGLVNDQVTNNAAAIAAAVRSAGASGVSGVSGDEAAPSGDGHLDDMPVVRDKPDPLGGDAGDGG